MRRALIACILSLACTTSAAAVECSFTDSSGLAFGTYDVLAQQDVHTQGTFTLTCNSNDVPVTIKIDRGMHATGSFSRHLASGADRLAYNVFLDPAHTLVWGDGSGGTSHYVGITPNHTNGQTIPIYADIPAGQDISPGLYGDSLQATVDW